MNLSVLKRLLLVLPLAVGIQLAQGASSNTSSLLIVTPQKASGIYTEGEKIIWDVKVQPAALQTVTNASYIVLQGGKKPLSQGTLTFSNGSAVVETSLDAPGTVLLQVTPNAGEEKPAHALGGAVVDPDKIGVSAPVPDDFDAFWKSKIKELSAIPANPVLEKVDSGKPDIDYWKITLDNIHGTHIRGQLARPANGDKFPAMLIVQWAGVYPLQKAWVLDRAAEGWLVLDIEAHDIPIDEPKEFYDKLSQNELKNYTAIGNDSRETSYFLRMFLGCYQAADYLAHRPDWDGRTLVVTGTSQGGLQSFVTAALYPKITAMMATVPAGCDHTGSLVDRKPGWPRWEDNAQGKDLQKVLETSRYFDAVNFATRIKCPTLVGLGLIDTTARPEGILAACNQLKGPKEVVIAPLGEHHQTGTVYAPFFARLNAWRNALVHGQSVPPPVPAAK